MVDHVYEGNIYWINSPKKIISYDNQLAHGVNRPFLLISKKDNYLYMVPLSTSTKNTDFTYSIYKNDYNLIKDDANFELIEAYKINENSIISDYSALNPDDYYNIIRKMLVLFFKNKTNYDNELIDDLYAKYKSRVQYKKGMVISSYDENGFFNKFILLDFDEKDLFLMKICSKKNYTFTKKIIIDKQVYYIDLSRQIKKSKNNDYNVVRHQSADENELKEITCIIDNNTEYSLGNVIEVNGIDYIYFGLVNNKYYVVKKNHYKDFPMLEQIDPGIYNIKENISFLKIKEIYSKIISNYRMSNEVKKKLAVEYNKFKK